MLGTTFQVGRGLEKYACLQTRRRGLTPDPELGLELRRAAHPGWAAGPGPGRGDRPGPLCRAPHRAGLADTVSSRLGSLRNLDLWVPGRLAFWEANPTSRGCGLKFRSGLGHMCRFCRLAPGPGWNSANSGSCRRASQNVGRLVPLTALLL